MAFSILRCIILLISHSWPLNLILIFRIAPYYL
jgi:hypothetical protein